MYENFIKPVADVFVAFLALIILSPVMLLITILLMESNKFNPFFVQQRPGKRGKIFGIIKFRTMNNVKNQHGILLPDYHRLTFFGNMLRKTSLDELPQLLNVIKGDMSLIGPRPLLPEYLPLYSEEQRKRHDVKPGITGWAQINGRNAVSWEEKFKLDIEYVNHLSPLLDLKIALITIKKVISRHGVNVNNAMTMETFKGNTI